MQKSWRSSDIIILLVLLTVATLAGLLLFQQQRTHLRINDLESQVIEFGGAQHEVQTRLSELSDNIRLLERAAAGDDPAPTAPETTEQPADTPAARQQDAPDQPAAPDQPVTPAPPGTEDNADDAADAPPAGAQLNQAAQAADETETFLIQAAADDQNLPKPARTPTAAEKRGDWLIRHLNSEPSTLNPLTSTDFNASVVKSYLYDSLADRHLETLQWSGTLAESWKTSPDGMTITFKLRPNISWSDGEPITARDAVFSYELIMNSEILAMQSRTYFQDISSLKAIDDRTLEVTFARPYFLAFQIVASMTIIPQHIYGHMTPDEFNRFRGDARGDKVVGSGPYILERWTQSEVRLSRNNRYHGQAPNFDKIVFRIVRDDNVVYQMLQADQMDYIGMSAEQWQKAQNDPQVNRNHNLLSFSIPSGYNYIAWNNNHPIFQDPVVRRAMTHLVPRERIRDEVFSGMARIVTGPFWPGNENIAVPLQYNHNIEPWPYDPHEALRLLASRGWRDHDGDGILDKDGRKFSFRLMLPGGAGIWNDIGSVIKENMARVGIEVEVRQMEWTMFIKNLDERTYDAIALAWSGSLEGDPVQIWHSDAIKNKGSNHVSFSNAEVDEILIKARQTLDVQQRNALYHRFHEILHQQQPYTFLFTSPARRAVHKRFENVIIHSLNLDDREWWVPVEHRKYGR